MTYIEKLEEQRRLRKSQIGSQISNLEKTLTGLIGSSYDEKLLETLNEYDTLFDRLEREQQDKKEKIDSKLGKISANQRSFLRRSAAEK